MTRTKAIATVLSLLLVASVAVPGLALAQTDELSMSVTQEQMTGAAIVTVSNTAGPVSNANVTVESNDSYEGNGTHVTGPNGTVTLPNPNETVNATITATNGDQSVVQSVTLVPWEDSLDVEITQNATTRAAEVAVTQYGEPVNASVNVTADGSYAGTGESWTGDDGTISLPAPDSTVNVTAEATLGDLSATTESTLQGPGLMVAVSQDGNAGVHINVTDDGEPADGANVTVEGDYVDNGTYTNVTNGTLKLAAPEHNTTITVTATYEGDSAQTTAELTTETNQQQAMPFGQRLVRWMHEVRASGEGGSWGQMVSSWVHANNPSSADDDAGPPEHANNDHENQGGPSANGQAHGHDKSWKQNDNGNQNEDHGFTAQDESDDSASANATVEGSDETETPDGHGYGHEKDDDSHGPPAHAGPKTNKKNDEEVDD